ncbi:MAG: class I SAM-dependent methyltransferase [Chloroflexota bacterium]|nr:class I SAM-dependent methyltransferase [Anaerolineae bacterium]
MGIYEKYAEVYDSSGQIGFSLRMIPYLQELLDRHPVEKGHMLDLACGTGTVAMSFASNGWDVWGVDASSEMLAQAERKGHDSGLTLRLSCQDMRRFTIPASVRLVTCLYDSMNYILTLPGLQAVLKRVVAHLAPGGLFLFDMNTAWALEHVWDHHTFLMEDDDLSLIMASEYDEAQLLGTISVTGFVRRGTLYERFSETHIEQAYSENEIRSAISVAGLRLVACYDCFDFDPPAEDCSRIMWVASKIEE